ncbi:glycosyltransferase [Mesorhizobium marinum]|uniref:glycosyltransferase n=1 Tax=Mesorhizobium marinum TaxID=3228790 RepID=UPI00346552F5
MISVIIPARNAAGTIGATLSSLSPDRALIGEILLIDDGSEDGTGAAAEAVARELALPLSVARVSAGSAGAARNFGLDKASGEWIFFLDADDVVMPGAVAALLNTLRANPGAGLAVGASIHRASGGDKLKLPGRYVADRAANVRRYLANDLRSITVGSALVTATATAGVRFPESIGLDEDTLYWAKVLSRTGVASIEMPVLVYNIDETRMAERFVSEPRRVFLDVSLELNRLAEFGIGKEALQHRKAFVAQRIARHLLRRKRYREAAAMMRAVRAHPKLGSSLKSLQYRLRSWAGRINAVGVRPRPRRGEAAPALERILILTADPAFPPVSGGDLRNHQNATAAARFGEVVVVSVAPLEAEALNTNGFRIEALSTKNEPRSPSLGGRRTSIEVRIPQVALARLRALVDDFRPDTIIVEGIPLFALLKPLRTLVPRLIVDMHNVESELVGRIGARPSFVARLLPERWSDQGRIRRRERLAIAMADRVWVCSEADRNLLAELFGGRTPVDVVPNGIPRPERIPAILPAPADNSAGWPVLLFIGHLGYQPNVVAAERLAASILPSVRRAFPSARLILAGRSPHPRVAGLVALPGVELVENPHDLSTLYEQSHVAVVPLSSGGGTRIKILEAAAAGLPVVATPVGAEGLAFEHGDDILIADSDEELAACIVELCSDPGRFERQRQRAFEQARRLYGSTAIEAAVAKGLVSS